MNDKLSYRVKVYVVVMKVATTDPYLANRKVIAVKLSKAAAQDLSEQIPGTFVEKYVATKDYTQVHLTEGEKHGTKSTHQRK